MKNSNRYQIRTMNRNEIDLAVEWAAREGWNPGLHDADSFYAADNDGFLIGLLDDEPIATISVMRYGDSFGFLGFYITKPEFRGQGYGIRIWNEGMKRLEGRNVGLDGVVAQQENYKKSGFKLAYRNVRYEGCVGDETSTGSEQICSCQNAAKTVQLSTLPFEIVEAYDRDFFPAQRTPFLKSWINLPDSNALGIVRDGKLVGYGMIRRCRSGHKIGPLFADNSQLAESLFLALRSTITPGETFYLDVPEVNPAAVALAEQHQMSVVFETARMYTGEQPAIALDRLFGVTSFELG